MAKTKPNDSTSEGTLTTVPGWRLMSRFNDHTALCGKLRVTAQPIDVRLSEISEEHQQWLKASTDILIEEIEMEPAAQQEPVVDAGAPNQ